MALSTTYWDDRWFAIKGEPEERNSFIAYLTFMGIPFCDNNTSYVVDVTNFAFFMEYITDFATRKARIIGYVRPTEIKYIDEFNELMK